MCKICTDYRFGLITKKEAIKNLNEKIASHSKNNLASEEEFDHILEMEKMFEDQKSETD